MKFGMDSVVDLPVPSSTALLQAARIVPSSLLLALDPLRIAAGEQASITRLRLKKLLVG